MIVPQLLGLADWHELLLDSDQVNAALIQYQLI